VNYYQVLLWKAPYLNVLLLLLLFDMSEHIGITKRIKEN